MALKNLIRTSDGTEMLVDSLSGHEDCELLESGVTTPRVSHCKRINGRWRIDKNAYRRMVRSAHLNSISRLELVEMLEARLDAIEALLKSVHPGAQSDS